MYVDLARTSIFSQSNPCLLAYVVSGHRFDIYEDIGCQPAIYNTPVAYALVLCWPIAIGLASGAYCCAYSS